MQIVASALKDISSNTGDAGTIMILLKHMFPDRVKELLEGHPLKSGRGDDALQEAASRMRIQQPNYFPVYFCRTVPETIFSFLQMDEFKTRINAASSNAEVARIFDETLNSLPKGSLKQYDFVNKLGVEMSDLPIALARWVGLVISSKASTFGNEFIVNESIRAIAAVFSVARRLSSSEAARIWHGFWKASVGRSRRVWPDLHSA